MSDLDNAMRGIEFRRSTNLFPPLTFPGQTLAKSKLSSQLQVVRRSAVMSEQPIYSG
jgi:hypothetical protein